MSKTRVHWRAKGYSTPRARCGAWYGTAQVTRDRREVTCRKCLSFLVQADLSVEAVRGRSLVITTRDEEPERGTLIEASAAGLKVCRSPGQEPKLIRWTRIKSFDFVDQVVDDSADGHGDQKDVAGRG